VSRVIFFEYFSGIKKYRFKKKDPGQTLHPYHARGAGNHGGDADPDEKTWCLRSLHRVSVDSFISKNDLLILQIFLRREDMVSKTKISDGYSTVLPAEIRKALNLTPGDILQWDLEDGIITIHPRKKVTLTGICGVISAGGDAVNDKKKIQSGK
jgi:AbrB family looped-hinge helix DNA binding protein